MPDHRYAVGLQKEFLTRNALKTHNYVYPEVPSAL